MERDAPQHRKKQSSAESPILLSCPVWSPRCRCSMGSAKTLHRIRALQRFWTPDSYRLQTRRNLSERDTP